MNSIDPDQQINGDVQDLEHWISNQQEWQQEHLVAWLFGAFAVLALALAAVGLYPSVVSYIVARRTHEIGIRMALGAQRAHVLRIVFVSMVTSVAGSIAVGLILTWHSTNCSPAGSKTAHMIPSSCSESRSF